MEQPVSCASVLANALSPAAAIFLLSFVDFRHRDSLLQTLLFKEERAV
jgi:hypothetical protein